MSVEMLSTAVAYTDVRKIAFQTAEVTFKSYEVYCRTVLRKTI